MTRRRVMPGAEWTNATPESLIATPEARAKFREELAKLRVYLHNRIKRRQRVEAAERKLQQLVEKFQREILDIYQRHIKAAKREVVRDAGRKGNKRYDAIWAEIEPVLAIIRPLGLKGNAEAAAVLNRLGREGIKRLDISDSAEAMAKRIARRRQGTN